MKRTYIYQPIILLALLLTPLFGQAQEAQKVINAMKSEVDRNKNELKINNLRQPFYLSYTIQDISTFEARASNGALVNKASRKWRTALPFLLVGNYEKNNASFYGDGEYILLIYGNRYSTRLTRENDPKGIARAIWGDMDRMYKGAAENYETKQATLSMQNLTEEDKNTPDYLKADPINLIEEKVETKWDETYWENFVKKASEAMKQYPQLLFSDVSTNCREIYTYYYNTEGGQYAIPTDYYALRLNVSLITDDGQEISDQLYFEHANLDKLPKLDEYIEQCEKFASEFVKLKTSKMIDESYIGPVLIEDMALGQSVFNNFFRQENSLTAKRAGIISSGMQRYSNNSKARSNKLEGLMNKKIISRSLSITSLTGSKSYGEFTLDGYYPVDAEGVIPDKEFRLVENGVLRNMINGRIPTKKIKASNGHMRYNHGKSTNEITPGNILMTHNDVSPDSEMKKKLIDAAKEEDLEYAYIIRRMRGSSPIMLYRVNVEDGSEELVRGATIADFNLRSFKRILAASDQNTLTNLASGGALISIVAPKSMLFEELEINKNTDIKLKNPFIVPEP